MTTTTLPEKMLFGQLKVFRREKVCRLHVEAAETHIEVKSRPFLYHPEKKIWMIVIGETQMFDPV